MECKFQVGERVVCVDNTATKSTLPDLVEGNIYTIQRIEVLSGNRPTKFCHEGEMGVWLGFKEIPISVVTGNAAVFHHKRFRPLKTVDFWIGQKQDLGVDDLVLV